MPYRISCLIALFVGAIVLPVTLTGYQFQTVGEFVDQHPGVRFHGTPFYRSEGITDEAISFGAIYGTTLATGATPQESALSVIAGISPLLGDDWGSLEIQKQYNGEELLPVKTNNATDAPGLYTFRFNQVFEGLPVLRSGIGFVVRNEPGNPAVVAGIDIKNLPGFHVGPVDPENVTVTKAMLDNVARLMDQGADRGLKSVLKRQNQQAIRVSDEQLLIFAGANGKTEPPQVAVQFVAERGSVETWPDYKKYLIVASRDTGDILLAETGIHNVDITGTVMGRATAGLASLECDPEAAVAMPFAEVGIVGGATVFADANGNYTIPHSGTDPVMVRSWLRGRWFQVRDQQNNSMNPNIIEEITPPGPANFLHNPNLDEEFATSNVNGYLEANVVRSYSLEYQPGFPVIGIQQSFRVNTNINDVCNAYYDGSSINFYIGGFGCFNTSMSDIVYHEYGHHLVNVSNNGQGEFGEGAGDVIGLLIQDEPVLAYGFFGDCNSGLRNADNTLQYPCSGSIHTCGQVLSGAVWDVRNQLAVTEPSTYRELNSTLFLGMLMIRGQLRPLDATIDPFITELYLVMDDDDANLNNGTPHYNEIAAGFGLHNLAAPPLTLLEFEYPTGRPELVPHSGGVAFNVQVSPSSVNPVPGTCRMYVDIGSGFQLSPMNEISPNLYQASFPPTACAQEIRYYFVAEAEGGIDQSEPLTPPGSFFTALSASSIRTGFYDDFETHKNWFDISTATDGFWERGVPDGNGTRGDPLEDADGSGQCYLTGNFPGNSDVDDGYTWLVSPLMDATGPPNEEAILTYWRWYSNSVGEAPESDVFVVELSNNSGSTFTVLETVGPGGAEVHGGWVQKSFRISDYMTPTNTMRVVFKASDEGEGSIVEAAVDGVAIKFVTCESSPPVIASEIKVGDGVVTAGTKTHIDASDDTYLEIDPEPTINPQKQIINMFLQAVSPVPVPNSLRFRVEAKMLGGPAGDVIQTVRLFNYQTHKFETIDVTPATDSDSIMEAVATGDLSRFVQSGLGEITARIGWSSPSFNGPPFTWSVDLDEAVWLID